VRIPHRKIYQAFPELDVFSDDEARRYLRTLARQGRLHRWIPLLLGVLLFLVLFVSVTWLVGEAESTMLYRAPLRLDAIEIDGISLWDLLLALIWVVPIFGAPPLLAWMVRDGLIRRALTLKISFVRCPECEHSLIGLPLLEAQDEPGVRCPECGRVVILARYGLKPEDLHPSAERTAAQKARIAE
jgi:DNA-directed RNA polymerase subunit RPC12/RpoP